MFVQVHNLLLLRRGNGRLDPSMEGEVHSIRSSEDV